MLWKVAILHLHFHLPPHVTQSKSTVQLWNWKQPCFCSHCLNSCVFWKRRVFRLKAIPWNLAAPRNINSITTVLSLTHLEASPTQQSHKILTDRCCDVFQKAGPSDWYLCCARCALLACVFACCAELLWLLFTGWPWFPAWIQFDLKCASVRVRVCSSKARHVFVPPKCILILLVFVFALPGVCALTCVSSDCDSPKNADNAAKNGICILYLPFPPVLIVCWLVLLCAISLP